MTLTLKLGSILLFLSSTVNGESLVALKDVLVSEIFSSMGYGSRDLSVEDWETRLVAEGKVIPAAMHSICQEKHKNSLEANKASVTDTEIIIVASFSDNGGGLIFALQKLLEKYSYRKFKIVFKLNYLDPMGNDSLVLHKFLQRIKNWGNVDLPIKRFCADPNEEKRILQKMTDLAAESNFLQELNAFETIDSLDGIIKQGTNQVIIDGILGAKFQTIDKTTMALIKEFIKEVKAVPSKSNLTVVVNEIPSGMDSYASSDVEYFHFHFALCMGWKRPVLNFPDFWNSKIILLFFELPTDKLVMDGNSLRALPNEFLKALNDRVTAFIEVKDSIEAIIKVRECGKTFAVIDGKTGEILPA